ncbi:MAG TPA: hypothetical protein VGQ83_38650 [Polyangia bacterium]|jgi:hypothetical protein
MAERPTRSKSARTRAARAGVVRRPPPRDPACWEFWASLDRTAARPGCGPTCGGCPIHGARTGACHEVRPWQPGGTVRAPSCPDCVFFATVRGIERDEL